MGPEPDLCFLFFISSGSPLPWLGILKLTSFPTLTRHHHHFSHCGIILSRQRPLLSCSGICPRSLHFINYPIIFHELFGLQYQSRRDGACLPPQSPGGSFFCLFHATLSHMAYYQFRFCPQTTFCVGICAFLPSRVDTPTASLSSQILNEVAPANDTETTTTPCASTSITRNCAIHHRHHFIFSCFCPALCFSNAVANPWDTAILYRLIPCSFVVRAPFQLYPTCGLPVEGVCCDIVFFAFVFTTHIHCVRFYDAHHPYFPFPTSSHLWFARWGVCCDLVYSLRSSLRHIYL